MRRVPGHLWVVALAAVVLLVAASAASYAAPVSALQVVAPDSWGVTPYSTEVNPRFVAGAGALVVSGLLLLLFFYRRRLYILFWVGGWGVLGASMFVVARPYVEPRVTFMAYGISQFLAILSGLLFVVAADAYPTRPRLWRGYTFVILPMLLWFGLAPIALGPEAAFVPGHLLIAGGLAAAGIGHLLLLRQARMLGAAVIGAAFLVVASLNVWTALKVAQPDAPAAARTLLLSPVFYFITALGMHLMAFEDMTYELRRTNRRLETAQGKLRRMVITDPLTGCRNRRFFDEIIGRELQRHRRYHIPLSVLFVDIDRFKAINDTFGHEAGDQVLRDIASFLLEHIREADYVFRWGGDEFLILISCTEEEARRRGVMLQQTFHASAAPDSLTRQVSLSIGCAEIKHDNDDIMSLVRVADERMYENKRLRA